MRKIILLVYGFVVGLLLLYAGSRAICVSRDLAAAENRLAETRRAYEALLSSNERLAAQIGLAEDTEGQERAARVQFGFVLPNDRVYIIDRGIKEESAQTG